MPQFYPKFKMDKLLEVKSLGKSFKRKNIEKTVFSNIDFHLFDQEIISIIGPSGCGKSTLLNIISEIESNFQGEIIINDRKSSQGTQSKVSYMQQKDLLLPWRNVLENAILGLEINKLNKQKSREKALKLLPEFGLEGTEKMFPKHLSGGMRQRVSFLRSILLEKPIMLLDEPFSALDSISRSKMHEWVSSILMKNKKSVVLVTHDIHEAVLLSDRVLIMGGSPINICREFKINIDRPRNKSSNNQKIFSKYEKDISDELLKHVPKNI